MHPSMAREIIRHQQADLRNQARKDGMAKAARQAAKAARQAAKAQRAAAAAAAAIPVPKIPDYVDGTFRERADAS